ncbi:MAG: TIGR04211 family SH3 domain-containing protein [Desulfarculaceae bacterium]|nr:TIGR04211 family SH3 domain-containing protein [Desulfarculaceae bacterium]
MTGRIFKHVVLTVAVLLLAGGLSHAEQMYVKGITRITMRSEPGVRHSILAMLESGTRLEMLLEKSDWSKVRLSDGREGWVLTRFVTEEKPEILLVQDLKEKNKRLSDRVERLKSENARYQETNAKLNEIETKYKELKEKSENFLSLEKKHEQMKADFQKQKERNKKLEERLDGQVLHGLTGGAAVLFIGILLGLGSRKKRKSSLL